MFTPISLKTLNYLAGFAQGQEEANTVKALRGEGAYSKSYIFGEIYNNFPNFTIAPITKSEQEIDFESPF